MKRRIFIVLLVVGLAFWIGRQRGASTEAEFGSDQEDTRQSFQLSPGARVEVRGINGSVDIETADTDTAEVHIVRHATNKSDLERHRIIVEQTPTSLVVRGANSDGSWWDSLLHSGTAVRQQVTLKIPRRSEVKAKGVNGPVKIGEIEGSVEVSGINGRVEVAQATGRCEINGINGGVTLGLAQLGQDGLRVSGINGSVDVILRSELNADVKVNGLNGGVSINASNMTIQEPLIHSRMRARIGEGGAPLTISGINGRLSFQNATAN